MAGPDLRQGFFVPNVWGVVLIVVGVTVDTVAWLLLRNVQHRAEHYHASVRLPGSIDAVGRWGGIRQTVPGLWVVVVGIALQTRN